MKKYSMVLLFTLVTIMSFGQEFLGIKVDGKKDAVINAFKLKGFTVKGDSNKDAVTMLGNAAGKSVELVIQSSPITKTVWQFSVYLPEQSTWTYLKSDYEEYLKLLTQKYGSPDKTYSFFSSPYSEGDGYEMTGVYVDKCHYTAFWPSDKGVRIKITKWKQVCIIYENSTNSALDDKETNEMNAKAF